MSKQYTNVGDMLRDLLPETGAQLAREVEAEVNEFSLSDALVKVRTGAGLKQSEVADRLGWQQSKISKLENSPGEEIRLGDFMRFISACGHDLEVFVTPQGVDGASRVKMHAQLLGRALEDLAALGQKDPEMADCIKEFNAEVLFNVGRILGRAMGKVGIKTSQESQVDRAFRIVSSHLAHDERPHCVEA